VGNTVRDSAMASSVSDITDSQGCGRDMCFCRGAMDDIRTVARSLLTSTFSSVSSWLSVGVAMITTVWILAA
jgi:hypothetical protein